MLLLPLQSYKYASFAGMQRKRTKSRYLSFLALHRRSRSSERILWVVEGWQKGICGEMAVVVKKSRWREGHSGWIYWDFRGLQIRVYCITSKYTNVGFSVKWCDENNSGHYLKKETHNHQWLGNYETTSNLPIWNHSIFLNENLVSSTIFVLHLRKISLDGFFVD
jgi:hypothetical protein